MKRISLETAISEIDNTYDYWKLSEMPEARRCYEQYVECVIFSCKAEARPALDTYWNGLKRGVSI